MVETLRELTEIALRLPRDQRLSLASRLLEADEAEGPGVQEAWERELKARIEAIDSGKTAGASYDDVMRDAAARLGR